MNHIYKTVWNAGLQAWVAVGELTKAHGKTKSSRAASSQNGATAKHRHSTALLLAAGLSTFAQPVLAANIAWSNPGTDAWSTGANWVGGAAPASGDTAIIDNGGKAELSAAGIQVVSVIVGFENTDPDATSALGILTDGTLSSSSGSIGLQANSQGDVSVQGVWNVTNDILVGNRGYGTLQIDGGTVTSNRGLVANDFDTIGMVTLQGAGASWSITDKLWVGAGGAGTLIVESGGILSSGSAEIGQWDGSGNGSGGGEVQVRGGGTWNNTGILDIGTYTWGTLYIDGGSVTSGGDVTLGVDDGGQGTLLVQNGGIINVGSSGSGTIFIGSHANSPGSQLVIGGGSAPADPGTVNAATVAFGSGEGSLVFRHNHSDYNFLSTITSGSGSAAIVLASGTTRFSANTLGSYSGRITVDGGTLALTAGQTLSFLGEYIQSSNGTLRVDVTNDTTYGKLVANTAILPSNAKIHVNVADANFNFTAASLADIIATDGALTSDGTFDVTDNSTLFNFSAVKDGNTVDLILTAAGGGGGGGGLVEEIVVAQGNTPATGAARALDTIIASDPSGPVASLFVPFTTDEQVNTAVTQTLPLLTGGSQLAASVALTGINRVVQARIESNRGLSSGDVFYGDQKFWMKPFGSWADQDDRKGVSGYKANTGGIAFGADATISDQTRLGLSLAYARADVDGNSSIAPNSAKVDVYQLVGYGSHAFDQDTELNFQVGIGQNRNDGKRHLTSFGLTAEADYTSLTATAGAGLGKTFKLSDATSLTPSIRADYTWIKDKGYTETGAGALNLDVKGRTTDELILAVDGKVAHEIDAGATLTANLGVGYDVLNEQSSITAAFAGVPGAAFTTKGLDPSPWLLRGGLGIVKTMQSGMEITARYDAEYRQDFLNQTASVKVRWAF